MEDEAEEHESVVRVREKLKATGKTQMEIVEGTKSVTRKKVAQTTVSRLLRGKAPNMRIKTLSALEKYADSILATKEDTKKPGAEEQQTSA